MDRMYLKGTIEHLEREKAAHPQKFGANPVHQNCMPNFDAAIGRLKAELEKLELEATSNQTFEKKT